MLLPCIRQHCIITYINSVSLHVCIKVGMLLDLMDKQTVHVVNACLQASHVHPPSGSEELILLLY